MLLLRAGSILVMGPSTTPAEAARDRFERPQFCRDITMLQPSDHAEWHAAGVQLLPQARSHRAFGRLLQSGRAGMQCKHSVCRILTSSL